MLRGVLGALQGPRHDVTLGKVGDRVATRLEEHDDALAVGDPGSVEADAHAPAQRLGEQESRREWLGHEEAADGPRRERSLLP